MPPLMAATVAPVLLAGAADSSGRMQRSLDVPKSLHPWLQPQTWVRDTEGPILSLGEKGAFDDTHIFAPCVAYEEGRYSLWYCGSQGEVARRVFSLGRATSQDGKHFEKGFPNPVFEFGDGQHSILTPALLRRPDGQLLRENGKLRMWFTATALATDGMHQLHQATSEGGITWSDPSPPQLENVYAPTILKEEGTYRMWFTDVTREPWIFRHAASADGRVWKVDPQPVLSLDQYWEQQRLFYPTVLKIEGVYLMWYGSYWSGRPDTTALGFAVSEDGLTWYKHPENPVLKPDPNRFWESHYTTSQSIRQEPDGSFRIWYASRKAPPFVNKYFALNTARWDPPPVPESPRAAPPHPSPDPTRDPEGFMAWEQGSQQ